ncbi:MAG TPA: carboxyltransferase domain-containing protein, partial [Longimicrobium sp.]|nr:carboxyltransferase domain-containing protein [Longimicrobium sp.]
MIKIELVGDAAVQIVLGDAPDEATRRRVAVAAERLRGAALPGVIEYVPGFNSITVHYDPLRIEAPAEALTRILEDLEDELGDVGRTIEIPVCYGGELGPDLEAL